MLQQETKFQLDMTSFYSAERVLEKLGNGWDLLSLGCDPDLCQLAMTISAALLFDRIVVPLPSVLDVGVSRTAFGDKASSLALELATGQDAVVNVLNIDDAQKQEAQAHLKHLSVDYCAAAMKYFSKLKGSGVELLSAWAVSQLSDKAIRDNTYSEQDKSTFHGAWTEHLTDQVLRKLARCASFDINQCDDGVKAHIVRTSIRGFVYECSGYKLGTYYLPHYVREGILCHGHDPDGLYSDVYEAALRHGELVGAISTLPSAFTRVVPFMTSTVFRVFHERRKWSVQAIVDAIAEARSAPENKIIRKAIRDAQSEQERAELIQHWVRTLDKAWKIRTGREQPLLLAALPPILGVIKLVDDKKLQMLLELLSQRLDPDAPLMRRLRNPIFWRTHLRYLWRNANGECCYIGDNLKAD